MDVVIRYGLYNVGDSVASDIVLTEAGFGSDDFDVAEDAVEVPDYVVASREERESVKVAIDALVAQSGTSVPAVDGFFFTLGRRICLETEPPQCDRCPLESCCEKRIARFQPIIRTTYY